MRTNGSGNLNSNRWQMMPNYKVVMRRLELRMLKVESFVFL
jgi:hypothetical protein